MNEVKERLFSLAANYFLGFQGYIYEQAKKNMEQARIYFYDVPSERVQEQHVFLNNFYNSLITIDGKGYSTVEHYYQASKVKDPDLFEEVRSASTPDLAKHLGRKYNSVPGEFTAKKDQVMYAALTAKFVGNPDLKERLLATGDALLIEDSSKDMYWGGALNGSKNKLGELLMQLRTELRNGA